MQKAAGSTPRWNTIRAWAIGWPPALGAGPRGFDSLGSDHGLIVQRENTRLAVLRSGFDSQSVHHGLVVITGARSPRTGEVRVRFPAGPPCPCSTVAVRVLGTDETRVRFPPGTPCRYSTVVVHLFRNQGTRVRFLLPAPFRDVAQLGRALGWGPRGRWFKSSHPDHQAVGHW